MTKKSREESKKELRDLILQKAKDGAVVFKTLEGLMTADLDDFIKQQPADGILYDLNRLPETALVFMDDPKWINDFAVGLVIRRLKELLDEALALVEGE